MKKNDVLTLHFRQPSLVIVLYCFIRMKPINMKYVNGFILKIFSGIVEL